VDELQATRVRATGRLGGTRPVVVDTAAGPRFVKLRGAADGPAALVAEVIVAELAEALGLTVAARSLVTLNSDTPTDDPDQELGDLLAASVGPNLGFAYLPKARDFGPDDLLAVPADTRAAVLWLDRLTLNPDRTAANPNLMLSGGRVVLIDHGAALGFHYAWAEVTEDTPRRFGPPADPHLFESPETVADVGRLDEAFAARLPRDAIDRAVGAVPDEFLHALAGASAADIARRRAAYAAFLWKRLKAPRPFLGSAPQRPSRRRARPDWLESR
jgi:hypothetical protein